MPSLKASSRKRVGRRRSTGRAGGIRWRGPGSGIAAALRPAAPARHRSGLHGSGFLLTAVIALDRGHHSEGWARGPERGIATRTRSYSGHRRGLPRRLGMFEKIRRRHERPVAMRSSPSCGFTYSWGSRAGPAPITHRRRSGGRVLRTVGRSALKEHVGVITAIASSIVMFRRRRQLVSQGNTGRPARVSQWLTGRDAAQILYAGMIALWRSSYRMVLNSQETADNLKKSGRCYGIVRARRPPLYRGVLTRSRRRRGLPGIGCSSGSHEYRTGTRSTSAAPPC